MGERHDYDYFQTVLVIALLDQSSFSDTKCPSFDSLENVVFRFTPLLFELGSLV